MGLICRASQLAMKDCMYVYICISLVDLYWYFTAEFNYAVHDNGLALL